MLIVTMITKQRINSDKLHIIIRLHFKFACLAFTLTLIGHHYPFTRGKKIVNLGRSHGN